MQLYNELWGQKILRKENVIKIEVLQHFELNFAPVSLIQAENRKKDKFWNSDHAKWLRNCWDMNYFIFWSTGGPKNCETSHVTMHMKKAVKTMNLGAKITQNSWVFTSYEFFMCLGTSCAFFSNLSCVAKLLKKTVNHFGHSGLPLGALQQDLRLGKKIGEEYVLSRIAFCVV